MLGGAKVKLSYHVPYANHMAQAHIAIGFATRPRAQRHVVSCVQHISIRSQLLRLYVYVWL